MSLGQVLRDQAGHCRALGSPFTGRLLDLASARLDRTTAVGRMMLDWPGDTGPYGASVPLRFAGALHALKLRGDEALTSVYPPHGASDDVLWRAVMDALVGQQAFLATYMQSPPQTNEVRRSAAIIPAAAWVAQKTGRPLAAMELGASAGLNLLFDRFALEAADAMLTPPDPVLTLAPEWRGDPPPLAPATVRSRAGVDLRPVDPHDPNDRLRLLSYIWADQSDRIQRTETAIAAATTTIDRGDAAEWLATRLAPVPGVCRFVFHTVAWQYFPADVQHRARTLLGDAGDQATAESPLAWFGMEADNSGSPGAALHLTLWPGGTTHTVGRADFHGRWIDWRDPDKV